MNKKTIRSPLGPAAVRPTARLITALLLLCAGSAQAADTVVNVPAGAMQFLSFTPISPGAADTYTLNNLGIVPAGFDFVGTAIEGTSIQGSGAGAVTLNNDAVINGSFSFGTATGPITLNNRARGITATTTNQTRLSGWHFQGTTTLGSGGDTVNNEASGAITTAQASAINFGGGADRWVNAGALQVGHGAGAHSLVVSNLETFENSGDIVLGGSRSFGSTYARSNERNAERLVFQGTAFVGMGDSRIAMDARLGTTAQSDCATLAVSDCVVFEGGSTSGVTRLTISDAFNGTPDIHDVAGFNEGIALIQGSSAAAHFVLDPNSENYVGRTSHGEGIQKGLVVYHLTYDTAEQKHELVGILADEAFQAPTLFAAAQEAWRATAGSWFDRQADLRATPGGLTQSNGLWSRAGYSSGDRSGEGTFSNAGSSYSYDTSHRQTIGHLLVGADFLGASSQDSAWVVGGMMGLARSDVSYDATPSKASYVGFAAGLYASWIGGPLFVDAALTGNFMDLNADAPNLNLGNGVQLDQAVDTTGLQVEAGWRIALGQAMYLEPIASFSQVKTDLDDIVVPDGAIAFDGGGTSSRLGAGLRLGVNGRLLGLKAAYGLTGRYVNESDGKANATILLADASETPVSDDFSGGFSELLGSLNLYTDDGSVSAFLNLGGKFGDDYSSTNVAVGVRARW